VFIIDTSCIIDQESQQDDCLAEAKVLLVPTTTTKGSVGPHLMTMLYPLLKLQPEHCSPKYEKEISCICVQRACELCLVHVYIRILNAAYFGKHLEFTFSMVFTRLPLLAEMIVPLGWSGHD